MAGAAQGCKLRVWLSFQFGLDASYLRSQQRLRLAGGVTVAEVIDLYGSSMSQPRSVDVGVVHPGAEVVLFCRTAGFGAKVGPDSSCVLASFFGDVLTIPAPWRPLNRGTRLSELSSGDPSDIIELCLCAVAGTPASQTQCEPLVATPQLKHRKKASFELTSSPDLGAVSTCDTLDVVSEGSDSEEPESSCSAREEGAPLRLPPTFRPPPGLELPSRSGLVKSAGDGSQRARKGIRNRALPRGCDAYDCASALWVQAPIGSGSGAQVTLSL